MSEFLFSARRSVSDETSIVPPSRATRCGRVRMGLGLAAGVCGGAGREERDGEAGALNGEEKTDWNENFEYLQLELGDLERPVRIY